MGRNCDRDTDHLRNFFSSLLTDLIFNTCCKKLIDSFKWQLIIYILTLLYCINRKILLSLSVSPMFRIEMDKNYLKIFLLCFSVLVLFWFELLHGRKRKVNELKH